MLIKEVNQVTNEYLRYAIAHCEKGGLKFHRVYVDPRGEASVLFDNVIEDKLVRFILSMITGTEVKDVVYDVDYTYIDVHDNNGNKIIATEIYTPYDWKY